MITILLRLESDLLSVLLAVEVDVIVRFFVGQSVGPLDQPVIRVPAALSRALRQEVFSSPIVLRLPLLLWQ